MVKSQEWDVIDEMTMSYAMLYEVLPGALVGLFVAACWYGVCRYIRAASERAHQEAILLPANLEAMGLTERVSAVSTRRKLAGGGSPVDRMFFCGLAVAAAVALAWFFAWLLGVTPASDQERLFITELRASQVGQEPRVAGVVSAVDNSLYVSRRHFLAAVEALRTENPLR